MRVFALLGFCFCSRAHAKANASCVLDSLGSVDQLMDDGLYIWAAIERCGNGQTVNTGGIVACEVDVAGAAASVAGVLKFILRAVDDCQLIKSLNHRCASEALLLGQSISQLVRASGAVLQKCDGKIFNAGGMFQPVNTSLPLKYATCAVDVKNSMASVSKAIAYIYNVKDACAKDSLACTDNAVAIISALSQLSLYVVGAVSACSPMANLPAWTGCATHVASLVAELLDIARASSRVNKFCKTSPGLPMTGCPNFSAPDCVTEYSNAQTSGTLPKFFDRCQNEDPDNPLYKRCKLCCSAPLPAPVPAPAPSPTILVPTPVPAPSQEAVIRHTTATILVPTPVPSPSRLYSKDQAAGPIGSRTWNLAMAALLPMTAVLSFIAGRKSNKSGPRGYEAVGVDDMQPRVVHFV